MDLLFAMSIRQPWIDMILRGEKSIEIRNWEIKRRGLVALHAPLQIDFDAAFYFGYHRPWLLSRGKVLGVASIAEVFALDDERWQALLERHRVVHPFVQGSYGAELRDVRALSRPIVHPGRLYFFPLSERVASRVRKDTGLNN